MKITDPDVIKNGEKDLIDSVKEDLDLEVVKQILKKRITASVLTAKGGQIVVHNNEVAFKMEFDLNLSGSLMFDRDGNYISQEDEESAETEDPDTSDAVMDPLDEELLPDADQGSQGKLNAPDEKEEITSIDIDIDTDLLDTPLADETDESTSLDDPDPDMDLDDDLKIELPEYDLDDDDVDEDTTEDSDSEVDDLDQLADDLDLDAQGSHSPDPLSEEGIDDILKESREFWDRKTDS